MKNIPMMRWIKFAIVATIYILWVIWVGSYWLLLGLPIVFDMYITNKIPWSFWKNTKDGKKPNAIIEWIDAIVFALVAVYIINIFVFQNYKIPTSSLEKSLLIGDHLFVSKANFGPRLPNTPLSFPLVQNTLPIFNTNSYTSWPSWDYKRLKGFEQVERGDIVVFNFPAGDTIAFIQQNPDIYNHSRHIGAYIVSNNNNLLEGKTFKNGYERNHFLMSIGRRQIANNPQEYGEVMYRPVDRRENYVKRCVAIAGDTFEIKHNDIYINSALQKNPKNVQHDYHIVTNGKHLSNDFFKKYEISNKDKAAGGQAPHYRLTINTKYLAAIKKEPNVTEVYVDDEQPNAAGFSVFPYSPDYGWSRDNFGPLWIPKKGATTELNINNIVIYERIITSYEKNKLQVKNDKIYINGELATSYTFKMDYYFMMGDNRHQSADSRYWGFVPEDHVVGKPILVWLSLDEDKGVFPLNIRWGRFFKFVDSE